MPAGARKSISGGGEIEIPEEIIEYRGAHRESQQGPEAENVLF
jgi:hypothetical protein